MPAARLSALDASFLEVEGPTAHMHVGWAATFAPPVDRRECDFEVLRDHVASRLARAPRYRQKLAGVPLDVHDPVWVDDEDFRPERHVRHATERDLGAVVRSVMSTPLDRGRPLWELWIDDRLPGGRVGMVGKAHHCMVDGLAAVELSTLLLDPTPDPPPPAGDGWQPTPAPSTLARIGRASLDRVRDELGFARWAAAAAASPRRLLGAPAEALRTSRTIAGSILPLAPPSPLNRPGSARRHLATARRPLDDLRAVKRRFGTTVNDVLLAASAGALRRYMVERGLEPAALKTMVPVSVRDDDDDDGLGNRISFMFVELPCDRPDAAERLLNVHAGTARRKESGAPERADAVLRAAALAPRRVQHLLSRLVSSPRMFNVVVSNIPGPREPLYLNGCELLDAYPVVPLAGEHALSIGMTTVQDDACFGLYADRRTLPDVEAVARHLDASLDELAAATP
jgi:diacylglycerol O-acyltransferase / wax synthase